MAISAGRGSEPSGFENAGQVDEMYTAQELHRRLKISVKTIYGCVQAGRIPYVRIGSSVRFPRRQILEWIEQQSYQPRPTHGSPTKKP